MLSLPTPDTCPICGYEIQATTGARRLPEPGDVCMCWGCLGILQLNSAMQLVKVTDPEIIRNPSIAIPRMRERERRAASGQI